MKKPKCKTCREEFVRVYSTTQRTCGRLQCAIQDGKAQEAKRLAKEQKVARMELRERRNALRPRSYYVKLAQASFNAFIRERDIGQVCISCQKPPKKVQAGHFKTTAARPDIRFHPFNNNLQCFHCNVHKSGAIDLYRPNLIKKIGLANVEWLEQEQPAQNLTVDDLVDIKIYYKEKLKQLTANKDVG